MTTQVELHEQYPAAGHEQMSGTALPANYAAVIRSIGRGNEEATTDHVVRQRMAEYVIHDSAPVGVRVAFHGMPARLAARTSWGMDEYDDVMAGTLSAPANSVPTAIRMPPRRALVGTLLLMLGGGATEQTSAAHFDIGMPQRDVAAFSREHSQPGYGVRELLYRDAQANKEQTRIHFTVAIDVAHKNNIRKQIMRLSALVDGWVDGITGRAPDATFLRLIEAALLRHYPSHAPKLRLYPNAEGNVQAEWWFGSRSVVLEMLRNRPGVAEWCEYDVETREEAEREVNIKEGEDWAWVVQRLLEMR